MPRDQSRVVVATAAAATKSKPKPKPRASQLKKRLLEKTSRVTTVTTTPTSSTVAKKRRPPRYRNITRALRGIRNMQKDTHVVVRRAPMVRLVRDMASDYSRQLWLRPSTVEALQQVVDAAVISVLQEALERRVESMTDSERLKQSNAQVMEKHIAGAFNVWCRYHNKGDFLAKLKKAESQ